MRAAKRGKDPRKGHRTGGRSSRNLSISILANVLTVLVVMAAGFIGSTAMAGGSLLNNKLFPEGTTVDGIDIGSLTYAQGRQKIAALRQQDLDAISVNLDYAGHPVSFTAEQLGISYDIDSVLQDICYSSQAGSASLSTRFEAVLQPILPAQRETELVYDREKIAAALQRALSEFDIAPVDAQATFQKENAVFTYSPDVPGRRADITRAADDVIAALNAQDPHTIRVAYDAPQAEITRQKLQDNTVLIGECSTPMTKNENRNNNIRLMCEAVDGRMIPPGETFSINALVGERTEAKGFRSAPAIVDGNQVDDVGGGICQLSGTLYNAALLADMEIVERVRHTYPSAYLPIGLDATLNWNNKDLKIKNNSEYPVYISAVMDLEEMTVDVRLYGQPLEANARIEIVPEVIREIKPKGKKVELTTSLPAGQTKVVQSAQNGYEVIVYRNYYKAGELVSSQQISHDTYNTREATVLVGTGSGVK